MNPRIAAVTVDLDDTVFPQATFLAGAWNAVAAAGAGAGLPRAELRAALGRIAAEGSDRGRIIDRALAAIGAPATLAAPLVAAFRAYRPDRLATYPGVRDGLARLRSHVPVACITDGDPAVQAAKLTALGLTDAFDAIVISDAIDRSVRKPHPAPFRYALVRLGVTAEQTVHIGDRPDKDIAGAIGVGMRAIRVRTGEYADRPDSPAPWRCTPDAAGACALLERLLVA